MSFLSKIGGLAKKAIPIVVGAATGGLGGAALASLPLLQGASQQGKADKLNKQQLQFANQRLAELAPLRQAGIQGMLNPQRPDLSAQYGGTQNPFAQRPPIGQQRPLIGPLAPPTPPEGLGLPPGPQGPPGGALARTGGLANQRLY